MLVAPDHPAALASAILKLVHEPRLRETMGAAARERVAREFNVERQAQGLHEGYLAALEAGRPPLGLSGASARQALAALLDRGAQPLPHGRHLAGDEAQGCC